MGNAEVTRYISLTQCRQEREQQMRHAGKAYEQIIEQFQLANVSRFFVNTVPGMHFRDLSS